MSAASTSDLTAFAISRLQSRYADVVTRRAWPELTELFLPAASIEVDTVTAPPRTFVGPGALGEFIAGAIARFDHFSFVILNAVVGVESATAATGRIFMCEIRHERESDTWSVAHGVYRDAYRWVGDRWLFANRRYRSMARMGADAGVFGLPDGLGPLG